MLGGAYRCSRALMSMPRCSGHARAAQAALGPSQNMALSSEPVSKMLMMLRNLSIELEESGDLVNRVIYQVNTSPYRRVLCGEEYIYLTTLRLKYILWTMSSPV